MLKKAGIVVAAAAAGLLAVSPLAFAGEGHYKGDDKGHHKADHKSDHKDVHYTKYDHSPTCQSAPQATDNSVGQSAVNSSPLASLTTGPNMPPNRVAPSSR